AAGCHYVDIAGEQLYLKRIFDTFAAAAEAAGVTVVPGANDDGLPSDLIAHIAAEGVSPVRGPTATARWERCGSGRRRPARWCRRPTRSARWPSRVRRTSATTPWAAT